MGLKLSSLDPSLSVDLQYLGISLPLPSAKLPEQSSRTSPSPIGESFADFLKTEHLGCETFCKSDTVHLMVVKVHLGVIGVEGKPETVQTEVCGTVGIGAQKKTENKTKPTFYYF